MEAAPIINRVANSGLVTLDLEDYYHPGERVIYDLKDNLHMGLILKEKDFRAFLKEHDWSHYAGKNIAVTCTEDAIIPTWAYMLLTLQLQPHAHTVVFGGLDELNTTLYHDAIASIDLEPFRNAKVVVKGCSNVPVPTSAYVELTRRLAPVVQTLMFGEPCCATVNHSFALSPPHSFATSPKSWDWLCGGGACVTQARKQQSSTV
jgi:hypothetical protein